MKGSSLKHMLVEAYVAGARSYALGPITGEAYEPLRKIALEWADKRLQEFAVNTIMDLNI